MDKREISMYSVQDIVEDLLNNRRIKAIARTRKISKNTVKKYRSILHGILEEKPELQNSIFLNKQIISSIYLNEKFF